MNEQQKQRLAEMPSVNPHRPYDDDKPDGYLASFRDWAEDNEPAVRWFLENPAEIREALTLLDQAQRDKERVGELIRDFATNWDCDTGANGSHPSYCRKCSANKALDQAAIARGEGEK